VHHGANAGSVITKRTLRLGIMPCLTSGMRVPHRIVSIIPIMNEDYHAEGNRSS
jgi:hypothetical protein